MTTAANNATTETLTPPAVVIGFGAWLDGVCPICEKPTKKHGHKKPMQCCSYQCAMRLAKQTGRLQKIMAAAHSEKAKKKTAATLTGHHGWGRAARDNRNHHSAKAYRLRTPKGIVIEVKNLTSWCRKNKEMFENWKNAQVGLTKVGAGIRGSWHGWTAVCVFDIECDPLNRKPSNKDSATPVRISKS